MDINKIMNTYDVHVAGEAFRIIIHSPFHLHMTDCISLEAILKRYFLTEIRMLLNEPRGHRGITGCVITPSQQADFGIVFLHHYYETYFSYSGLFAALTTLIETGTLTISKSGKYAIETTHGIYHLYVNRKGNEIVSMQMNLQIGEVVENTDEWELVQVDRLRNYYIFKLPSSIPAISLQHLAAITSWAKPVLRDLNERRRDNAGIMLTEALGEGRFCSVTFEGDGFILRSPGVDSTIALLTLAWAKGKKTLQLIHENLVGSSLTATITDGLCTVPLRPVLTGEHQFVLQAGDPLEEGFLLK
ncbi:proline racemase family protein [Virgibacillus pantothenticus]|uniref:Proline racemase n=1 Tax=Virgibacillus pantothenticus TaxID=1473 RepID=A0A0L0QU93_VIRPA|nr:proline racemase family protein [Virgibacillus pantothenticus]KNE22072.1 hypothetical protein AFK71_04545 [Virgibacillus pantothenticus]MED3737560.1 proline racemase family protein [Virgibacillus pantothenticus]QTY17311.1 proline racemase family protein [Virgibacillus pantothenticus]SIS93533.1 Proline racemase [Virgibacillus pantothenticus]